MKWRQREVEPRSFTSLCGELVSLFLLICLTWIEAPISVGYVIAALMCGLLLPVLVPLAARHNPRLTLAALVLPPLLGGNVARDIFLPKNIYDQHHLWFIAQWVFAFVLPLSVFDFYLSRNPAILNTILNRRHRDAPHAPS